MQSLIICTTATYSYPTRSNPWEPSNLVMVLLTTTLQTQISLTRNADGVHDAVTSTELPGRMSKTTIKQYQHIDCLSRVGVVTDSQSHWQI